jgi:hypothetical protein
MMNYSPEFMRGLEVFRPGEIERYRELVGDDRRLVHYTDAAAAIGILRSKQFWMRNAACVNDFLEVEYGRGCLQAAYKSPGGQAFKDTVDQLFPGLWQEVADKYNAWSPHLTRVTYLACFSEHRKGEDGCGRLSMWRAYGGGVPVAIVMRHQPFIAPSDAIGAYTYPVSYLTESEFGSRFDLVAKSVETNADFVRELGREYLLGALFEVFKTSTLCTKHRGFSEEIEWRVVYTHEMTESSRLVRGVETIRGMPQVVFKIPLQNVPNEGFVGAEIPEILDHVIVGPTEYPAVVREALVDLLGEAGVPDAASKVVISDIPIRQLA